MRTRMSIALTATIAAAGTIISFAWLMGASPGERSSCPARVHGEDTVTAGGPVGLWTRYPDSRADGDPVRFYFFHESGIGLYRYGKIGLNTTNSFTWRVVHDDIELTFKKSGVVARTCYNIRQRDGKRVLVLDDDPKEPLLHTTSYTFVPPPSAHEALADINGIGGRLWIDQQHYATGGTAFSLYQLRDPAIDGRGVGWHHLGDFDDWSTEALAYRDAVDVLELSFNLRGDKARTKMSRSGDTLTLEADPRNFWHVRTYKDGGPSFGYLLSR